MTKVHNFKKHGSKNYAVAERVYVRWFGSSEKRSSYRVMCYEWNYEENEWFLWFASLYRTKNEAFAALKARGFEEDEEIGIDVSERIPSEFED